MVAGRGGNLRQKIGRGITKIGNTVKKLASNPQVRNAFSKGYQYLKNNTSAGKYLSKGEGIYKSIKNKDYGSAISQGKDLYGTAKQDFQNRKKKMASQTGGVRRFADASGSRF
jgi:hypothetical protein